jgi:hypothetical protein
MGGLFSTVILPAATVLIIFAAIFVSLWAVFRQPQAIAALDYPVRSEPLVGREPQQKTPAPFREQAAALAPVVQPAFHPRQRKHTAVAGATGDGKTTTLNTLLVQDIAAGAQCVVCSTHFTYYHPEDQQIDLRPLRDCFEVYYTPDEILKAMTAACALIDQRLDLYRKGQDVGHDITLYFGEWDTAIQRTLGDKATERLLHILDEGRKTRIWVGFIEVHGAQVKRFGGDGALRAAFTTRLAGNIDATSWRALVGDEIPRRPMPRGTWMTPNGQITIQPPSQADVLRAVQPRRYEPIVSAVSDNEQSQRVIGFGNGSKSDRTSTDESGGAISACSTGTPNQYESGTPDTDAPEPGTDDFLIYELVRRGKSANQVHETVGGTRAAVLDKVRKYKEMLDRVLQSV